MNVRNDLAIYEENAARWWQGEDRYFRSLRSVGEFHLGLIEREWGADLSGSRVADLGCGGGYLALELAARGAEVTGVDQSSASIEAARGEARRRASTASFLRGDLLRTPLLERHFDFVVMSDVIEHLVDPAGALAEAARLLRPGGRVFVNTFDRSRASAFAVVHLAEGLGLVPRGTHDARLFLRPAELEALAKRSGLRSTDLVWERPALLRTALTWTVHLREAGSGHGYSAFLEKTELRCS